MDGNYIVFIILAIAVLYLARRAYHSLSGKGGCGCGSGSNDKGGCGCGCGGCSTEASQETEKKA